MVYLVMILLLAIFILIALSMLFHYLNQNLHVEIAELQEKLSDSEKLVAELQYAYSQDQFDDLDEAADEFYEYVYTTESIADPEDALPPGESRWELSGDSTDDDVNIREIDHGYPTSAKLYAIDYNWNK